MPIFLCQSIYIYIYETLNNIRVWILIIMKLNSHIVYIFYICQNNIASKSTACEMHVTERKQKDVHSDSTTAGFVVKKNN